MVYFNQIDFLGYPAEKWLTSSLINKVRFSERKKVKIWWRSLTTHLENTPAPIVFRMKDAQNHWHWIEKSATPFEKDADGKITSFIIVAREITESYQLQQEYFKASEKYLRLFEAAPDGIIWLNTRGRILEANDALVKMSGYAKHEFVGKHFTKSPGLISSYIPQYISIFKELLKGKKADFSHVTWKNKRGELITTEQKVARVEQNGKTLGFIIVVRDITERMRLIKELEESRAQLKGLARHLNKVREEEKAMLSRELHDVLGQNLSAMKFDLMLLKDQIKNYPVDVNLDETISLLDRSIKTTRDLSTHLRLGMIDDLGLGPSLEYMFENLEKRTGIKTYIHIVPEGKELDKNKAIVAYRIMQEAITNIMRHSGATEVSVKFVKNKTGRFVLELRDNGVGFNPKKVNKTQSFGILGMSERAESAGIQFKLTSREGKGTTIKLVL